MAQGYHDFVAGDKPTAADLEDYCELQSTMRFASAAARDSALGTVKTEGMRAYLLDVNCETVYNGSVWSTIGPVHGALTAWVPVITQSGAVTKTVTVGWSVRVGRLVNCSCLLAVTGSGTGSNLITLSLPYAATGDGQLVGTGYLYDASSTGAYYPCIAQTTGASVNCYFDSTDPQASGEAAARLGSAIFTAGLANGDTIACNLTYQAAADA